VARLLREPLVHFLVLGALLFLVYEWRGGGGSAGRVVVTAAQVEALAAVFARSWQRAPDDAERKSLVDEYVKDEVATREALATGLDRDDAIVRRRLRQKLEFLAEDAFEAAPASESDLKAWFDAHAERFRIEPRIAFRQVCLTQDRRGEALAHDVQALLDRLARAGPQAAIDDLGDSPLMPQELEPTSRTSVAQFFGEAFARAVFELPPNRWVGPVPSDYGLHVVLVTAKEPGRTPDFSEVRAQVEQDRDGALRAQRVDDMYRQLLEKYDVRIED